MDSLAHYSNESAKVMGSGAQNLQTLNDLYLLELSQAFAQVVDAGMIEPFGETGDVQAFRVEYCQQHQMVLLPTCPLCG